MFGKPSKKADRLIRFGSPDVGSLPVASAASVSVDTLRERRDRHTSQILRLECTLPWQDAVDIFPCLEELGCLQQRVIRSKVDRNAAQVTNLESGECMETSLKGPGVGRVTSDT